MTSYYHAHASHTAPSHEPTDELVSAATQAWGMLYAQPNKTMCLSDYLAELREELPNPDLVDAVIEYMEEIDWITIWEAEDDDEFHISIQEDSSEEGD